jgi:hypothetical protein
MHVKEEIRADECGAELQLQLIRIKEQSSCA